ncbi:MAG: response regulator [Anaerolineae bacterium]|nr:response regulator [Anaerolineae bacterium]
MEILNTSILYLTPAAIEYLTLFILAILISGYLLFIQRLAHPRHIVYLAMFFIMLTTFIGTLFLEVSLLPTPRLYAVFLQTPLLSISWVCLLQFAYHFPDLPLSLRRESRLTLLASSLYALWETGFAVFRFVQLRAGVVEFRPDWNDYLLLLFLLWPALVFIRRMCLLIPSGSFWQCLVRAFRYPVNRDARALRSFSLIFIFVAGLSIFNLLRTFYLLTVSLANAAIALGILIALFSFAVTYLNHRPEATSFMVKLAGITLTVMLGIMSIVGWMITPAYIETYQPRLSAKHALRFMPNDQGGYNAIEIPYTFESDLGQDLKLDDGQQRGCSEALDFAVFFYGQDYAQIYVCNDGALSLGKALPYRAFQYRYGAGTPLLLPLLMDLDPTISPGGVFARQEKDRLIVTWSQLRGFYQTEAEFTFQAILYTGGYFDFIYKDIPEHLVFNSNDDPGASLWAVGILPGNLRGAVPQQTTLEILPVRGGSEGMVQDYALEFRRYLHRLLLPLAVVILIASISIIIGFPMMFYFTLVNPLNALLEGVRCIEGGEYTVVVPVQFSDEIGFLTRAFNTLAAQLGDLIHNLEARVAARTAELDTLNTQLQAEIIERERAQTTIIEQQRALATMEAREHLARDLHDGLGQVMGYINVQAQAVQTLLDRGQMPAAHNNLTKLIQTARHAHNDIRAHILNLREPQQPQQDFVATVQNYIQQLRLSCDMEIILSVPGDFPDEVLAPAVEEQALYILQEGMNNVRKHAQASHVEIMLHLISGYVQMVIMDNGVGFNPGLKGLGESTGSSKERHFGLNIMRERAEHAGGTLNIHSLPGNGTRLVVTLPRAMHSDIDNDDNMESIKGLRVLLVDDHPLYLDGLRSMLIARGITVIGVANNGEEAQAKTRALHPEVVVMDLNMPKCGGLEATRAIKAEFPEVKVVILTVAEDETTLFEAIKSGASGYLLKNMDADHFCRLLSNLLRDDAPLAPGMAARILDEFTRMASEPSLPSVEAVQSLSEQQWEILSMIADGMLYREIATKLNLSEKTIKYHMGRILELLDLENRAQAIAYYQQIQD